MANKSIPDGQLFTPAERVRRRERGPTPYFVCCGCCASALRMIQVQVPAEVERGRNAVLGCRFELEGDTLYSVKWYKGGKEFFRVVPKDNPAKRIFTVDGITADVEASDEYQVVLKNVSIKSEGRYKCEVSAEAPNFQTVSGIAELNVVVPPRDVPRISVAPNPVYRIGQDFVANCTAFPSRPAAVIQWTVNGKPVREESVVKYPSIYWLNYTESGLEGTVMGVRLRLGEEHFDRTGKMVVTCKATVGKMQIDGQTALDVINNDSDATPRQRSLIHDSRSGASAGTRSSLWQLAVVAAAAWRTCHSV